MRALYLVSLLQKVFDEAQLAMKEELQAQETKPIKGRIASRIAVFEPRTFKQSIGSHVL